MKHYVMQYLAPEQLMLLFKCFIYISLCINGYQFISDDIAAASQLLNGDSSFSETLNIFAVTIDTIAWISLLVIFELETSVLEDDTLRGNIKWLFNGISTLCYIVIAYAFIGYAGKLFMLLDTLPYTLGNPCALIDTSTVITTELDNYRTITTTNCQSLVPAELTQINGQPIIVEQNAYTNILRMAWVDVINSATWILIVILLQLDIVLQLKGLLTPHIMRLTGLLKALLYTTLFIVAVIWGIYGNFIDFWDAVLWLLGFMIIELNIFNWSQEVIEEQEQQHA